jgi:hypothetical protein
MNNLFHWPRFARVFLNDLVLLKPKRVGIATLAVVGTGLLVYLLNLDNPGAANDAPSDVLFPLTIICGGLVFTSMIWGDMHHPLERFHYLTLPCTNAERFISRYLITAPLFMFYTIVVYVLFEVIASALAALWLDTTFPRFDPLAASTYEITQHYFLLHAVMFTGAIYMRSYALLRTGAALFAVGAATALVFMASLRVFYWEAFTGWFTPNPDFYIDLRLPFIEDGIRDTREWLVEVLCFAGALWVLLLGYLGLRDHEVQDGV